MSFKPPTAEQVVEHLQRHPPQGRTGMAAWLPLAALAGIMALTFVAHEGMVMLLPWLLLAGLFIWLIWRVRWLRDIEQRVSQVNELGMQRRWPQSLRLAWRLLPSLSTLPELHGRTVAMMAYNLEHVKAYDASIAAYNYLIDRLPSDHPGAVQLRIQRAIAQLAGDQLADADDALRRLRGLAERFAKSAVGASYRFAVLLQQVRTHHFAEAVEHEPDMVEALRPLGVEAGFGHAMLALAHHQLAGQADQPQPHRRDAQTWWSRATLLLPVSTLTARYEELSELAGALRATPRPWEPKAGPAAPVREEVQV